MSINDPDPAQLNDYGNLLNLSPEARKLLTQTGAEIKQKRRSETVPIQEIYTIGYKFNPNDDPDFSFGSLYKQIGLSPRTFNEDKNRNSARLTTKYALLGLLSEQTQTKTHQFTYNELGLIFSALTHHIQTRAKPHQQEVKDLQLLVMNMMLEEKD